MVAFQGRRGPPLLRAHWNKQPAVFKKSDRGTHPVRDACPNRNVDTAYGPSTGTGTTSPGSCVQGTSTHQPLGT